MSNPDRIKIRMPSNRDPVKVIGDRYNIFYESGYRPEAQFRCPIIGIKDYCLFLGDNAAKLLDINDGESLSILRWRDRNFAVVAKVPNDFPLNNFPIVRSKSSSKVLYYPDQGFRFANMGLSMGYYRMWEEPHPFYGNTGYVIRHVYGIDKGEGLEFPEYPRLRIEKGVAYMDMSDMFMAQGMYSRRTMFAKSGSSLYVGFTDKVNLPLERMYYNGMENTWYFELTKEAKALKPDGNYELKNPTLSNDFIYFEVC